MMNTKSIPIFKTRLPGIINTKVDSLYMRSISTEDADNFLELSLDKEIARFNNFNIHNKEESKNKIDIFTGEIKRKERFSYSIIKNNRFVGYYGIWIETNHLNYFREGIAILPDYRRQGIYTLCSDSMVAVLSDLYKKVYLVNNIDSRNTTSIIASKQRGFIQEGFNEIGELRYIKRIL